MSGALLLGAGGGSSPATAEERRLLKALARQIGILLSTARLQRQATTDALTTLYNRAHTELLLQQELLRARPEGQPLAVLLFDLDNFKQINDQHGHAVGDEVLQEVAVRLRRALRLTDTAGRWGGEEFLSILPGADPAGAIAVAGKIAEALGAAPISSKKLRVTASIGVAAFPGDGDSPALLVSRADLALYEAKATGKARAVAFSPLLDTAEAEVKRRSNLKPRGSPAEPVSWLACDLLGSVALSPGVLTLGRAANNALVLPSQTVSRHHGVLTVSAAGLLRFQDTSRHGSRKNGQPVEEEIELAPGDRLQIGPYEFCVTEFGEDPSLAETRSHPALPG